jgi:hypothetical protein
VRIVEEAYACVATVHYPVSRKLGVIKTRISKTDTVSKSNDRTAPDVRNPLFEEFAHVYSGIGKDNFDVKFSIPAFEVREFEG